MKHCFFIEETIVFSTMVIPVHHCYGSAVPSVQWRHGNYAIRKFLSILGNFPSRISFRYAENIPNMPKGDLPLESPRQRGQNRACPDYAECSRGKTVGQSPERLNIKPYTPIAPQIKLVRL